MLPRCLLMIALAFGALASASVPGSAAPVASAQNPAGPPAAGQVQTARFIQYPRELYPHLYRRRYQRPRYYYRPRSYRPRYYYRRYYY